MKLGNLQKLTVIKFISISKSLWLLFLMTKMETSGDVPFLFSFLDMNNTSLFHSHLLNMYYGQLLFKRKKNHLSALQTIKLLSRGKTGMRKLLRFKYIHGGKAEEIWE